MKYSEKQYAEVTSTALAISGIGVWDYDIANRKITFSKECRKILGYDHNSTEINFEEWLEQIHPSDRERVRRSFGKADANHDYVFSIEYRVRTNAGHYVWIIDQGKVTVRDESGRAIRAVGTFRDYTLKKQFEKDLNERLKEIESLYMISDVLKDDSVPSENKLKIILKKLTDGFQVPEKTKAKIEIFDYSVESAGYKYSKTKHSAVINTDNKPSGYIEVVITDNETEEVSFLQEEIELVEQVAYRLSQYFEIEERNRKLANTESKYKDLIENINDVLFEVDASGTLTYVSPSIEKIIGFTPEELVGKNIMEFGLEDHNDFRERFLTITERPQSIDEYTILSKSGEKRWLRLSTKAKLNSGIFSGASGTIIDISERKLAEFQKEQSNALYRSVLNSSPDSIVITDLQGKAVMVSHSTFKMFRFPKNTDISSYSVLDFIDDSDKERAADSISKMFSGEFVGANKYKGIRSDGSKIIIEVNGEFIKDSGGVPQMMIFITRDITSIVETEEKLKLNEEKFRNLVSSINDTIFEIDNKGTIKYVSPAISRMTGYSPEELIGTNFFTYMHPDDRELVSSAISQLGKVNLSDIEYRYISKSGEEKWFRSLTSPIFENGIMAGGAGTLTEITENKLKENEIHKLYQAVEQSPVSIVITDLNGNIEYTNPAFEKITGFKSSEVIGKNTRILKSGKTEMSVYQELWKTITSGRPWQGVWINKRKNGEYYWEEISITPILNNKGKLTNFLAVKQDITGRKKADEEIRDLNSNLEAKVRERTLELQNFFDVTLDLLCITDRKGKFLKVNEQFSRILGYDTRFLENSNLLDIVHKDDYERSSIEINRLKENDSVLNFENRLMTKDGNSRVIEWRSTNVGNKVYSAARDVTERKKIEMFQQKLLDLSSTLAGFASSETGRSIQTAIANIGEFLNADRSYIFEYSDDKNIISNTYEWCGEGIVSYKDELQQLSIKDFPLYFRNFSSQEMVYIPDVRQLPVHMDMEKKILEHQGIITLITIPIVIENKLIGFAGLDSVKSSRTYTDGEINILKLWSNLLASLINKERVENLLELTRQNFESFFETTDDFLTVTDLNGKLVYVNQTVLERLKYSREELIGKPILTLHQQIRIDEAEAVLNDMISGRRESCTLPLEASDGTLIQVESRIKKGKWNNQDIIFGISKDISQIMLSEQKFSSAFHSNSAMMAISDCETGNYLDVNQAMIDVLGWTKDEMVGGSYSEIKPFVKENLREEIIANLDNGIPVVKLDTEFRTKKGEVKNGLLSAEIIYIGKTKCLLTVTIDITERKLAEKALMDARREAEYANMAKSEFLSRMSHELRTPMNSILGFAQLLNMGDLNASQKKGVNHIMNSGKHLLQLINEILDISRIESGRLSLSIEPVSLAEVVREILEIMKPLAAKYDVLLNKPAGFDNEVFIKADKQRVKQILINLITNAIKYNKANGTVEISSEITINGADKSIRISVIDSGIGISEAEIGKLFTPFERLGADKTSTEGTGLGLSVVKKLVEAMGGKIGVSSKKGEGSTFWFEMSLSETPNAKNTVSEHDAALNCPAHDLKGTILLIEDNLANVALIEVFLNSFRPSISLYSDSEGKNALSMAKKINPDIILLDLNLPDIHGSEVLRNLKSDKDTSGIPVIIVSADAMQKQIEMLLSSGAHSYITKPIDMEELMVKIDEIINSKPTS